MPDTAVLDAPEINEAFERALAHDAQVLGPEQPPDVPAPPRRQERDPAAPHGRDAAGKPLAPYGVKQDGTPRVKPAGPGRPATKAERKDEALRTGTPAGARDYREDLAGLGMTVWMGGAVLPATRPYAHLFKQSMPGMVTAWNTAAQKNPTVRGYVEKLAGDGSWAWVIGVCVSTAPFIGGCLELAKKGNAEVRAHYAAAAEAELQQFMHEQMEAAGLADPEQGRAA